jgi:hypothetical protein
MTLRAVRAQCGRYAGVLFAVPLIPTFPATVTPVSTSLDEHVLWHPWVKPGPAQAVPIAEVPSDGVLAQSHGVQMGGVHARWIAAKVVKHEPFGDRAVNQFPTEAVSECPAFTSATTAYPTVPKSVG